MTGRALVLGETAQDSVSAELRRLSTLNADQIAEEFGTTSPQSLVRHLEALASPAELVVYRTFIAVETLPRISAALPASVFAYLQRVEESPRPPIPEDRQ